MAIGADTHLRSMWSEVSRQFGVQVTLRKPADGDRDPTTGTTPAEGQSLTVTAVPGRRMQRRGSFGGAAAGEEEGAFTVLASDLAAFGTPTDEWELVDASGVVRSVRSIDAAAAGMFWVITTCRASQGGGGG